jgi:hypothetical protein
MCSISRRPTKNQASMPRDRKVKPKVGKSGAANVPPETQKSIYTILSKRNALKSDLTC